VPELELSDIPTHLTPTSRAFMQERLLDSLRTHVRPVVEEPGHGSKVPELLKKYLSGSSTKPIVGPSRLLAQYLDAAQAPTSASAGLLMVMDVKVGTERGILLAKAEAQRGARAGYEQINGKWTFNVEYLKDLVFTQHSRVYKVGLFFGGDVKKGVLAGEAVDRQKQGFGLSEYWLTAYLGCRFLEAPEVLTERFLDVATNWINVDIKDPAKKASYDAALLTELRSAKTEVRPNEFIALYVESEDRDLLRSRLIEGNVPAGAFPKSTLTIANRLKRIRIEMAGGTTIDIPPANLDDGTVDVTRDTEDDAKTLVRVLDELRRVEGTGKFSEPPQGTADGS
jgi:hypothetical protein